MINFISDNQVRHINKDLSNIISNVTSDSSDVENFNVTVIRRTSSHDNSNTVAETQNSIQGI